MAAFLLGISYCSIGEAWADADPLPARTDVAGSRPQPEYDPLGIRIGMWIASPQLRTDVGYDSNLFGASSGVTGDGFVQVKPGLGLRSNWTRHSIDLGASGTFTRYMNHPQQYSNQYALRAGDHIDLGRFDVSSSVSIARESERNGTNGAPLSVGKPSQYHTTAVNIAVSYNMDPLSFNLAVSHENIRYADLSLADGTIASQDFRDTDQWTVEGKVNFAPSDVSALALVARWQHARAKVSSRTNDKTEVTINFARDFGMFRGAASYGYLRKRFSNPLLNGFNGTVYQAQLWWYATPLLTISASGGRSLENSGVPTVGVVTTYSLRSQVDYELLRNFVLTAHLSERRQYFPEISQRTRSRTEELKGEYRFNRTVAIGAYGRHECKDSTDTSQIRGFCSSLIGLSLTLKQ